MKTSIENEKTTKEDAQEEHIHDSASAAIDVADLAAAAGQPLSSLSAPAGIEPDAAPLFDSADLQQRASADQDTQDIQDPAEPQSEDNNTLNPSLMHTIAHGADNTIRLADTAASIDPERLAQAREQSAHNAIDNAFEHLDRLSEVIGLAHENPLVQQAQALYIQAAGDTDKQHAISTQLADTLDNGEGSDYRQIDILILKASQSMTTAIKLAGDAGIDTADLGEQFVQRIEPIKDKLGVLGEGPCKLIEKIEAMMACIRELVEKFLAMVESFTGPSPIPL